MADHLILSSLQHSPSLLFPCSLHHRWRFSGGSRFSVPELRLSSSQLQLVNSTSPSSSSSSEKFDIVSTTQLNDETHVFRFGDESEIERYLENEAKVKKQNAELEEEASDVLRKQQVKDGHTNVIKIKDRKRVRSPTTKKKKETSTSVNVSPSQDKVASVSNLGSIVSVAEAIPTSSIEENVVVFMESDPVNENVESLSSEVIEKGSVNEIRDFEITNGYQELTENGVEVEARPRSSTAQHGSQSNDLKEVVHVSTTIELDENLDVRETPMKSFEANENVVVEPTATATVSPDELISPSEATHHSVDEIAETPVIDTSEENLVFEPTATVSPDELISTSETTLHSVDEIAETPVIDTSEENPVIEPTATVCPDELISGSEATHHSVDKIAETPVIDMSEENLVVEPTATATVSPDELISASEETHHSVDEVAETPVVDTSEVVNEEENEIEDEIAVSDIKTDNVSISKIVNDTKSEDLQRPAPETVHDTKSEDLQRPAPETASLESIEVASDREEVVSKAFYLESGFASLQSPFKALTGREDAYFISHPNWLGVAEGVSQWSFEGIKKGTYAQELMSNCEKIISDETAKIADPVQVLQRSVDEIKSLGSSTALIAHLDKNELHIANIGDSGFMVIRNRKVLQKSSPMFHHFCFPLQITQGDDVLKLAGVYHVNLEEGDVIITATDGLFDNLYEKEIVAIVCRLLEQSLEPQKVAELVAAKAQEVGRSKTERTPFADAAKEEGYDGYKGGKLDDVTVIVSIVKTVST